MSLGPFFVGQKPANNLKITIRDAQTDEVRDISPFTGATLKMLKPNGASVDTTTNGGQATITDAAKGVVQYKWPTVSLFDQIGDYQLQVVLTGTDIEDYTDTILFEVHRPLGG